MENKQIFPNINDVKKYTRNMLLLIIYTTVSQKIIRGMMLS